VAFLLLLPHPAKHLTLLLSYVLPLNSPLPDRSSAKVDSRTVMAASAAPRHPQSARCRYVLCALARRAHVSATRTSAVDSTTQSFPSPLLFTCYYRLSTRLGVSSSLSHSKCRSLLTPTVRLHERGAACCSTPCTCSAFNAFALSLHSFQAVVSCLISTQKY
jgi:hypothetical protein